MGKATVGYVRTLGLRSHVLCFSSKAVVRVTSLLLCPSTKNAFALTSAFIGTVCNEWASFSCVRVFSALYVFTFPCRGQSSTIFLHWHLCCAPAAFVSIPPVGITTQFVCPVQFMVCFMRFTCFVLLCPVSVIFMAPNMTHIACT